MSSISSRLDSVTLEEVYSLLLAVEARVTRHQTLATVSLPIANVVQHQSQQFYPYGHGSYHGREPNNSRDGSNFGGHGGENDNIIGTVIC